MGIVCLEFFGAGLRPIFSRFLGPGLAEHRPNPGKHELRVQLVWTNRSQTPDSLLSIAKLLEQHNS